MIHDETYGNFGSSKTLNDGRTITPASHTPANNGEYNNNKDINPLGQSGNRSMTLELVMNESGFVPPATTGWSMAYEIEYDPIAIDLSTPDTIWTLDDFSLDDFERFLDVVSSARAQNGASQKEIENLSQQYENALVGLQEYSSNMDDVDIAKSVADIKKSEVNLALNYHFIDQVAKIDTLLIDDFLT
jgi:flagellin-like hook-associated protein FlgL